MNERIKEFAKESGFRADVTVSDDNSNHIVTTTEERLEKFAELIVRKCADITNSGIDPAESHLIGDDILEHFGVEE